MNISLRTFLSLNLVVALLFIDSGCSEPNEPAPTRSVAPEEPSVQKTVPPVTPRAKPPTTRTTKPVPVVKTNPSPPATWEGIDSGLLCLRTGPAPEEVAGPFQQSLLARELLRQAILVAARDELGMATRDEVLRETFGEGPRLTMTPVVTFRPGESVILEMHKGEVTGKQLGGPILRTNSGKEAFDTLKFISVVEHMSRRVIAERLRNEGVKGNPNRWQAEGGVPDAITGLLSQMNFVAQFAATRELHQLIRAEGESVARLAALSQAYAQLGLLCEHHFTAAHVVFKARALIYATRIAYRMRDGKRAYPYLAFTWALIGYRAQAQKYLAGPPPEEKPPWYDLLAAFLARDEAALKASFEDPKQGQLARLMFFLDVASPLTLNVTREAGRELLQHIPECYRVQDELCSLRGVSNLHEMTTFGPKVMEGTLRERVAALPGTPDAVRTLADNPNAMVSIPAALVSSGLPEHDRVEPSWAVLGRLIEETHFVHAWRRLSFMRDAWNVSVAEELFDWLERTAGHPHQDWLRSYGLNPVIRREECRALLAKIDPGEIGPNSLPYVIELDRVSAAPDTTLRSELRAQASPVEHDLRLLTADKNTPTAEVEGRRFAAFWYLTDPTSPDARARMIAVNWDAVQDQALQWAKSENLHPAVHLTLGKRFVVMNKPEEARKHLRLAAEGSRDASIYKSLADSYKQTGDEENWAASLEEYLRLGEPGLKQDRVRVTLAQHYLAKKDLEKAVTYSEAAAESWAAWAMECAVECAEAAENWERAELWVSRLSQRYPSSLYAWYFWCLRQGKGDRKAALSLIDRFFAGPPDQSVRVDIPTYAFVKLGNNERSLSLRFLLELANRRGKADYSIAMTVAVLAHLEGKTMAQKQAFEALHTITAKDPGNAKLVAAFETAAETGKPLDVSVFDEYIGANPGAQPTYLLVGLWLNKEGRHDLATDRLSKLVDSPYSRTPHGSLAAHFRREWKRIE